MLTIPEVAKLTQVAVDEMAVCGEYELPYFAAKIRSFDCICAGMTPRTKAEVQHLLAVLDRLQEFVRGEPVSEYDLEVALACSERIITSLMEYYNKSDDLQVDAKEAA